MFDKREYDRLRVAKTYNKFKTRRRLIVAKFGGVCFVCKHWHKHLHLHHIVYHKTESNYPRDGRSLWTRLKRLTEAEQHPERFRLLCPRHHFMLECAKRLGTAAKNRFIALL